ncbi:hypothetical protein C6P44_001359 [Monosporozyma unispora]|nr:hypothetical protein C6P44_001359 [Kazachstania unispora]
MTVTSTTRAEQNNIKAIISSSYNKLYSEFATTELTEVGNYKILDQIGEGSFGKVYLALHRPTHRKVVIKTSAKNDPNIVREVFYHRQFTYPYITKLYEIIVTETKVWMVLEYCPGKELYDHLLKMKRIPIAECTELFAQIVGAVYYAHSLNCVHRDLKLENILLDKNGNAKLTDFGFTRECMQKSSLETICGTTVYMAPELTERKTYDGFKIDIWALGVILYTMICGAMPFDEDDETKTKWKIINEDPEFNDNIMSPESKDLVKQLLEKDPANRPSVKDILLHSFLQPYGSIILEKTDKIIAKQRGGSTHFNSRLERRLLKRLGRMGFDTQSIKQSILKKKCDSLSGLWLLLLEKEKKLEKRHYPRRSRSILSVRRVIESSLSGDPMSHDDNLFKASLEVTKVASIGKMISKTADTGISMTQQLSSRKLSEPTMIRDKKSTVNHGRSVSSITAMKPGRENESSPKKNNIFKKMSDFFKNKKHEIYTQSNNGRLPNGSSTNSGRTSTSIKNSMDSSRTRNSPNKKSAQVPSKLSTRTTNVTLYNKQRKKPSAEKIQIEEPKVKRIKSTISSDMSRQASNSNYEDTDSYLLSPSQSYDNKKVPLTQLHSRPLSSISQMSNETYTSDYSTDGTTSFFQRTPSEASKPPLYKTNSANAISQYSSSSNLNGQSTEKLNNVGKSQGRFIRRTQSIRSETSSTSERSSKTDSFYDITTASLPVVSDMRNTHRITPIKESVLPRFGVAQHPWPGQRAYSASRRNPIQRRGRNRKSTFLKSSSRETDSVIKEEESVSSSGGDDTLPVTNGVMMNSPFTYSKIQHQDTLLNKPNQVGDKTETCSDEDCVDDENNGDDISPIGSNTPKSGSAVNTPLNGSYPGLSYPVPKMYQLQKGSSQSLRSPKMMSPGSEWSAYASDSKSSFHAASGDDDEEDDDDDSVHGADQEDNFSEGDFETSRD